MAFVEPDLAIHAEGPWEHRTIAANGARFHLVEAGSGPAVLMLHGFPTFWWTWREQVTALAAAGYRAIAMDLRGYGGSDHTPHGYDPFTLCQDIASVIECLGERQAVIMGHGWGGLLAWSMPVLQPQVTGSVIAVSAPHPIAFQRAARHWAQLARLTYVAGLQLPFLPEHSLTRRDGERVGELLSRWSADPTWLEQKVEGSEFTQRAWFQSAFLRWPTAHTAIEYHRWSIRSILRSDGRRYRRAMDTPVHVPVLQVHGRADPMVLPSSCINSARFAMGGYDYAELKTGHFPHEEAPEAFADTVMRWLQR